MVIAIGIFAVIGAGSYATLNSTMETHRELTRRNEALGDLQTTLATLERDIHFLASRPVQDGFGDPEAALVVRPDDPLAQGELLRLTVYTPSIEPGANWTVPRRVAWRFEDGDLVRIAWRVLDRDQDSDERRQVLVTGLIDATVSIVDWSPESGVRIDSEWNEDADLPSGIEIALTTGDGRQYRRVFEIANGN
jgi:general secretion pathway protein J